MAARRRRSQTVNGTPSRALVAADVAHVAWAVNLACLGFHVWPNRADDPEHADELRLDLDPQPGTGFAEARAAAWELKALLDELGIAAFPKTTGNRGLHVYVRLQPRWDSYAVRSAAVAAARELERRRPDILTAAWWKEERGRADLRRLQPERAAQDRVRRLVGARPQGRAGLDAAAAGRSSTTSIPTSSRSRPCPGRLERDGDPWAAIDDAPQSLEPLLALHERDRANGLLDAPWPPVYPKQPDEPPRVAPSRARARTDGRRAFGLRGHALRRRFCGRELAQAVLLDLAGDRHGEVVHDPPVARDLVASRCARGRPPSRLARRSAPRRRAA